MKHKGLPNSLHRASASETCSEAHDRLPMNEEGRVTAELSSAAWSGSATKAASLLRMASSICSERPERIYSRRSSSTLENISTKYSLVSRPNQRNLGSVSKRNRYQLI